MNNKAIMAQNIKKNMERLGITNQKLCDDLGFKYTTFMDWIKGVTYPRIGKIEAMADYFGIQKSDLIEDKSVHESLPGSELTEAINVRLNKDEGFRHLIETLYALDAEKLKSVQQMLEAFTR